MQLKKQTRRRVCKDCGARKGKISDLNCNNFENHSSIVRVSSFTKNEEVTIKTPVIGLQTFLGRAILGVDRRRRQVNVQA